MATDFKAEQALVQQASMLNETTRLNSKKAVKGWMVWIIPVGIVLFVVLCFVLQKATGMPFYSVLGLGDCTPSVTGDDSDEATECEEHMAQFSPPQRNIARLFIAVAVLVIVYFLYDIFQGGAASGLFGGMAGASQMHDVRPALRNEAINTQMMLEASMQQVDAQRMQNNIPKGTIDSSYPSNTPPSMSGAAGTTGQATTGYSMPQPAPQVAPQLAPSPAPQSYAPTGGSTDRTLDVFNSNRSI